MTEAKTRLTRVAVGLPLDYAVADVLPAKLVLQFDGDDGYPVDRQHHVDAVPVPRGIVPLPYAMADVRLVFPRQVVVETGFGLEVADSEVNAPILETMSQDVDEAVLGHHLLEALVETLPRVAIGLLDEALPALGLGASHELHQGANVQRLLDGGAVARVRRSHPSPRLGSQPLLDVSLEVLLGVLCHSSSWLFTSFFTSLSKSDSIGWVRLKISYSPFAYFSASAFFTLPLSGRI